MEGLNNGVATLQEHVPPKVPLSMLLWDLVRSLNKDVGAMGWDDGQPVLGWAPTWAGRTRHGPLNWKLALPFWRLEGSLLGQAWKSLAKEDGETKLDR